MDGATLSITVMIWLQVFIFPQSSADVHVLVIIKACGQDPVMMTSVDVMVGDRSQLSMLVAFPVLAGSELAVHSIVTSAGQEMAGPTLSTTVIV